MSFSKLCVFKENKLDEQPLVNPQYQLNIPCPEAGVVLSVGLKPSTTYKKYMKITILLRGSADRCFPSVKLIVHTEALVRAGGTQPRQVELHQQDGALGFSL